MEGQGINVVEQGPGEPSSLRQVAAVGALVLLAASALYGGNAFSLRDRIEGSSVPEPRPAAVGRASTPAQAAVEATRVRSQPWWQEVRTVTGDGDTTSSFGIDGGALQWRMEWTCERGRLVVSAGSDELIDAVCPAGGAAYATLVGAIRLDVRADGPWALQVDQHLDVPLEEPPLPAMTAVDAVEVATGDLYGIEQSATGDVVLYRLGDGSYALRLDDFFVTPNIDLEIHLSPRPEPRTSDEFVEAGSAIWPRSTSPPAR